MASLIFPKAERQRSNSERFMDAFGGAAEKESTLIPQHLVQQKQMSEENEALKKYGIEAAGIHNSEIRKQIVADALKGNMESQKLMQQRQEKMLPFQAGLQTVQRMRDLGEIGHLGKGTSIQGFLNPEAAKANAEYQQLGKSLIQLASSIPIRNKVEFETLAEQLYDPSIRDSKRAGIIAFGKRVREKRIDTDDSRRAR